MGSRLLIQVLDPSNLSVLSTVHSDEHPVALSADAGDEIFAGYNRYDYMIRYGKKLNKLPSFAGKGIAVNAGLTRPINLEPAPLNKPVVPLTVFAIHPDFFSIRLLNSSYYPRRLNFNLLLIIATTNRNDVDTN